MFTVLDGFLIAFVLVFIIVGARRGFIGQVARLLGGAVRLIISILLAKPIVKLLSLSALDEHMFDKYKTMAGGISDKFNVNLKGLPESEFDSFVGDALSDAKIPRIFRGLFKSVFNVSPEAIADYETVTLADFMGITITNIILLISSFVFVFAILWLISFLIRRKSKSMSSSTTFFARTNKWLGAVWGFVQFLIVIVVLFMLVVFFENMGWFKGLTEYINNSTVSGFVFKLVRKLVNSSFDLGVLLEGWLKK